MKFFKRNVLLVSVEHINLYVYYILRIYITISPKVKCESIVKYIIFLIPNLYMYLILK